LLYFKTMTENCLGKTSISAAVALHDAYWQGYAESMRLDPFCAEVLRHIRAADVKLAWVTNFTTARQMWKLERLGLADTADFLVTSEEAGGEKPDPATLRLALERLAVAPAEAWLVGDSLVDDAGAAAAAGVEFVWFRRDEHEIPTPSPQTISDWPTLRELLHVRRGNPPS
jgi:putative hydrolase of the HAD superfamily